MAAGAATLRLLAPESYDALEAAGARLEAGLRDAATLAGTPVSLSRVGSLLTVFFRQDPPVSAEEAFESDRAAYGRFFGAMFDAGILLPPSQFEAWFLSLAHGEAELEETLSAARGAFAAAGAGRPAAS
jgi:glutamate-1-semialdehyde 2,1-aminomutase